MQAAENSTVMAMGKRVKQARASKKWSLDRLSKESGVSRRMLVNIEHGRANPSVALLLRLSYALGVSLPALVRPELGEKEEGSSHQPVTLWRSETGSYSSLVGAIETPDLVELWDWSLQPGAWHSSEAHRVGTQEIVFVIDGVLHLDVDGVLVKIPRGGSYQFSGDRPHRYGNDSPETNRFSLTVVEPAPLAHQGV